MNKISLAVITTLTLCISLYSFTKDSTAVSNTTLDVVLDRIVEEAGQLQVDFSVEPDKISDYYDTNIIPQVEEIVLNHASEVFDGDELKTKYFLALTAASRRFAHIYYFHKAAFKYRVKEVSRWVDHSHCDTIYLHGVQQFETLFNTFNHSNEQYEPLWERGYSAWWKKQINLIDKDLENYDIEAQLTNDEYLHAFLSAFQVIKNLHTSLKLYAENASPAYGVLIRSRPGYTDPGCGLIIEQVFNKTTDLFKEENAYFLQFLKEFSETLNN